MNVATLIPAAGVGKRLKRKISGGKLFVRIKNRPIIYWTIKKFIKHSDKIVVAVNKSNLKKLSILLGKYFNQKEISKIELVMGGKTRAHSVKNMLNQVENDIDVVMIHDAARPFVKDKLIKSCLQEVENNPAVIPGVPVKDTIKEVTKNSRIKKTLERAKLFAIQTPQVFEHALIKKAYSKGFFNVTDDASLVEKLGKSVKIILGDYHNIKITTDEDLILANKYL